MKYRNAVIGGAVSAAVATAFLTLKQGPLIGIIGGGLIGALVAVIVTVVELRRGTSQG